MKYQKKHSKSISFDKPLKNNNLNDTKNVDNYLKKCLDKLLMPRFISQKEDRYLL